MFTHNSPSSVRHWQWLLQCIYKNWNNNEAFIAKLGFYFTWVFYKENTKYPYSLNSL